MCVCVHASCSGRHLCKTEKKKQNERDSETGFGIYRFPQTQHGQMASAQSLLFFSSSSFFFIARRPLYRISRKLSVVRLFIFWNSSFFLTVMSLLSLSRWPLRLVPGLSGFCVFRRDIYIYSGNWEKADIRNKLDLLIFSRRTQLLYADTHTHYIGLEAMAGSCSVHSAQLPFLQLASPTSLYHYYIIQRGCDADAIAAVVRDTVQSISRGAGWE